jgi:histidinol-phosphatase
MERVPAVTEDLALALELADLAAGVTLERFGAADLAIETKPDMTPVTEADKGAEEVIRARLATQRPEDAVVGEEYGDDGNSSRRWIIDPIDGTANYVRGIPVWATLVALQDGDELSVGVVCAPALGRRWWAMRGRGAFASDAVRGSTRQLGVSRVAAIEDAQLSISGLEDWLEHERGEAVLELVRRCHRTRGFGDFWAHMLVAEGTVDIAVDSVGVSLWDLAAPLIIVAESGGRLTDLAGAARADGGTALVTNGLLHDQALAILGP